MGAAKGERSVEILSHPDRRRTKLSASVRAKHYAFAAEYVANGGNAKRAAEKIGYSIHGRTLEQTASYLMRQPHVRQKIVELYEGHAAAVGVDSVWVLYQLVRLVNTDVRQLFHPDGSLRDLKDLSDDEARLIASFEVEENYLPTKGKAKRRSIGRVKKVKLIDRLKVIELVGKHINVGALRDGPLANFSHISPEDALDQLVKLDAERAAEKARSTIDVEKVEDAEVVG